MDIKSLLCSQQSIETNSLYSPEQKSTIQFHQRQPSWSSSSCSSSPGSPTSSSSSSSYYSIPSSPEIDIPSSPMTTSVSVATPIPAHTAATVASVTDNAGPITQRTNSNRHIHSQTRTPWSSEEDQLLQQGYSQGLSWAMISTVYLPHRSRGCCWGRFKTLQAKSLEQREWSDSEDRLLMLAIKKNSKLFKQAWKAVAQDMGNRNWKECEMRSTKVGSNGIIKKKSSRQS
ncbi:hypothetical protein HMPREF1544_11125 [Mucor circinelloides 1006PhL]|uniref:Myb-like domain-containing protein n=1 Tax=Mucor circinelloides f. circinelloides (strain 1006PhL) TaxID=1220926 RepID=S2IWP7_MUCC1|nr:hypothetical protein HMPREF1544_11125 [Mucor circinelloides 1006PhL]